MDYLYSNTVDISKIGYSTILEKTEKWHKKLQKVSTKDIEKEWEDYDVFIDFGDGFRIVQLKSESCYKIEWALMSHCVASYYGRSSRIYSLRDSKNMPHCTIEDGQQIKGKWNGKIDPKYIDYIVKFLEKTGMRVWENEMKNLGYFKLSSIDENLTCDQMYNGYVCEKNLDQVKDSEWRVYKGMWLWNVSPVCDIQDDWKFRLYEDIKTVVEYSRKVMKNDNKDYTQNASSWHYSQNASSWDSIRNASSWDYSRNSSSWDYSQNASSWDYSRNASSWDSIRNASSWDSTRSEINGKYGITADIWYESKAKGIIGTWIVLAEYKKNKEWYYAPTQVKCGQIDGKKLKENTWYWLKNWEFTETN